jgi:hypothetical protein
MMRSAFSSDLDNLAKFRLRRKKVPNRTELVAQRVPGLDKQMLDMAAALLVLLGNHALQDLSRESPFGKLSIEPSRGNYRKLLSPMNSPAELRKSSPVDLAATAELRATLRQVELTVTPPKRPATSPMWRAEALWWRLFSCRRWPTSDVVRCRR